VTGNGCEFFNDGAGREHVEYNPVDGVTVTGETRLVLAWLHESGLEAAAVAVADAHFTKLFADSALHRQWVGGDT
jgi:hypothetical protein